MKKLFSSIAFTLFCAVLMAQTTRIYVSPTGTGGGISWADAASLDSAISLAYGLPSGAQLWLQEGIYEPSGTVQVPNLVQIYGGFTGTESVLSARNFAANPTIIDARKAFGPVVHLGQSAAIDGLTIQNGLTATFTNTNGGAVYMEANAEVRHCYILNSIALNNGGGIYAVGNGRVVSTLIKGNKAGQDGFAVWGTTLSLTNNTVTANQKITLTPQDSLDIFYPQPFPDSATLNPSICYGEIITLGHDGPQANTFLWSTGAITPTITLGPLTGNTNVSVIITTADREKVFMLAYNITVKPLPTLTLSSDKNPAHIGDTVRITATASPLGGTYTWRSGDVLQSETGHILTQVMPAVGNLIIECTYSYNGCRDTALYTVINTECAYSIVPDSITASNNAVHCLGGTEPITLTVWGGAINSGRWLLYTGSCGGPIIDSSQAVRPNFKVNPTTTTTYYVGLEGCGSQTACVSIVVNIAQSPTIETTSDFLNLCEGDTITLTASIPGGTWSMVSTSNVCDIDPVTGLLTALTPGTGSRVEYRLPNGCFVHSLPITVNPVPVFPNPTDTTLCQGSVMPHPMPLGPAYIWTTNPSTIATVDGSGNVLGVNVGTTVLRSTFYLTGCYTEKTINVLQQPAPITGDRQVCVGLTTHLTSVPLGGTWTTANATIATVDATGLVTGQQMGNTVITYTVTGGCYDTAHIRVNPTPSIFGPTTICLNGLAVRASVHESFLPGTWSISDTTIATITPVDTAPRMVDIMGLAAGTFTLTFTTDDGCAFTTDPIIVNALAVISGDTVVAVGETILLTADQPGNNWISLDPTIATVDGTGLVTGVSPGVVTIIFTPSGIGTCMGTFTVRVLDCPTITLAGVFRRDTFCNGAAVNMQLIASVSAGASETTVSWTENGIPVAMPAGLTYDSVTFILSGNPTQSGTFYWTVSTTNQDPSCKADSVLGGAITIYDSLVGGTIFFEDGGVICSGQAFGLIESSVPGSGGSGLASSYIWEMSTDGMTFNTIPGASGGEIFEDTALNTSHIWFRRVFVDQTCGTAYSNVIQGTVNPLPDSIQYTMAPDSACHIANSSGVITITAPITNMMFSINDGDSVYSPIFTGVNAGTHDIAVIDTTTGCIRRAVVEVTTTNAGEPIISLLTNVTNDSLCILPGQDTITITPTIANAGATPTFNWVIINSDMTETTLTTFDTNGVLTAVLTATTRYRLYVTNNESGCENFQDIIIYARNPLSLTWTNPDSIHVCVGGIVPELVAPDVAPRIVTFQWQQFDLTQPTPTWQDIAGATGPTYQVLNTVASAGYYRVVVQDFDELCPAVISDSSTIIVDAPPATATATDSSRCGTGTVNLAAFSTTPGARIAWYASLTAAETDTIATTNSGEIFTTPIIPAPVSGVAPDSMVYYVEAITAVCNSSRILVKAFVYANHTITLAGEDTTRTQEMCPDIAFYPIIHTYGGGASGFSPIVWDSMPQPGAIHGDSAEFFGTIQVPGVYQWTITTTGNICPPASSTGTITVLDEPTTITLTPSGAVTACQETTIYVSGATGGTIYWQTYPAGEYDTTQGSGNRLVDVSGTYRFQARHDITGCWGEPVNSGVITIVTIIGPDTTSMTIQEGICAGFGTNYVLTATAHPGSEGPFTYQWYINDTDTNFGGTAIPDATDTSYSPSPDLVGTWYYYCVASSLACPTLTSAVSGAHTVTPLTDIDLTAANCTGTTNFSGGSLGTITYGNAVNTNVDAGSVTISGHGINQIWSAHVLASGCDKNTYDGGTTFPLSFNFDCRKSDASNRFYIDPTSGNPTGDFFSWCAVASYKDELCPAPWRVPTCRDFRELDIALGGTGANLTDQAARFPMYVGNEANRWGGAYGGYAPGNSTLITQSTFGAYWSQTQLTGTNASYLGLLIATGAIVPQGSNAKHFGLALRCVRGIELTDDSLTTLNCMTGPFTTISGALSADSIRWGGNTTPEVFVTVNSQDWTDVVTVTGTCNKTTFSMDTVGGFRTDCRNSDGNVNFHGDYFSWCFVKRYEDALCPYPWRVPSTDDFAALHVNLGYSLPAVGASSLVIANTYMGIAAGQTGGTWGGSRFTAYAGNLANTNSLYWSSSETTATDARALDFNATAVYPQFNFIKNDGFALRCVKDLGLADDSLSKLNCMVGEPTSGTFFSDSIKWGGNTTPEKFVRVNSQYWTDAVTVGGTCNKITYDGTTTGGYRTDCRNSDGVVDFYGDYFSWCFVKRYEKYLCPAPWRVPSVDDFLELDITLGGTGANLTGQAARLPGYIGTGANQWGGAYSGNSTNGGTLNGQGLSAYYWSQSETSNTNARSLYFTTGGVIFPQANNAKNFGFALRCVREIGLTDDSLTTLNCATGAPQSGGFIADSIKWGGNSAPEVFVTVGSQDWTDAVTVGGTCNKTTYSSGTTPGTFSTDCRNDDDNIHYFSWCFVKRYEAYLCPAPWRAPTNQDFINLDLTLGGNGVYNYDGSGHDMSFAYSYLATSSSQFWAGVVGGLVSESGTIQEKTSDMFYWSSDEQSNVAGYGLWIHVGNVSSPDITVVSPSEGNSKAFGIALRCVKDIGLDDDSLTKLNCMTGPPASGTPSVDSIKWGENTTPQIFTTVGTQDWTDVVTVGGICNKTMYSSGTTPGTFSTDCRNSDGNAYFHGDYFSWCFVKRYEAYLCPAPWRVPSTEDFAALHVALGYTLPVVGSSSTLIANTYMGTTAGQTGGTWGGSRFTGISATDGTLINMVTHSYYWSSTESFDINARTLTFVESETTNGVWPQYNVAKGFGIALRCVKEIGLDDDSLTKLSCMAGAPQSGIPSADSIKWGGNSTPEVLVTVGDQQWTDVVTVGGTCNKTTYSSGVIAGTFSTDCRDASDNVASFTGHYFSWCFVKRYEKVLCPYPWRVPDSADFGLLHRNLGYTHMPNVGFSSTMIANTYVGTTFSQIGGTWGGTRFTALYLWDGTLFNGTTGSAYWSSSEHSTTNAFNLNFLAFNVWPQSSETKSYGFALRCVRDTDIPDVPTCKTGEAEFGSSLGTITYGSATNTNIEVNTVRIQGSGSTIGQVWSGAVATTVCDKTTYEGGDYPEFYTDCRNNPGFDGHFFSWCAVARFKDILCPTPWRVPDSGDFRLLDIALGGSGNEVYGDLTLLDKYLNTWNGAIVGRADQDGSLDGGTYAWYWSQSEYDGSEAYNLRFDVDALIVPQNAGFKHHGQTLRCVRDFNETVDCPGITLTILAHPNANDISIVEGACDGNIFATLSVAATGTVPITYQWYSNTTNSNSGGTPILGATGSTFTPSPLVIGTTYYYCVVMANNCVIRVSNVSGARMVTAVNPVEVGCNLSIPGWGTDPLGASFVSPTMWTISGNGINQIWSDAVIATACASRTLFNGTGSFGNYNADCRNSSGNANFDGHYFSLCAVLRYADELCPAPWRVPTCRDFVELDLALGGTGLARSVESNDTVLEKYRLISGGAPGQFWGGALTTGRAGNAALAGSYYWSQTETNTEEARYLGFTDAIINPRHTTLKYLGIALRCVRDCDPELCGAVDFELSLATANSNTEYAAYQDAPNKWKKNGTGSGPDLYMIDKIIVTSTGAIPVTMKWAEGLQTEAFFAINGTNFTLANGIPVTANGTFTVYLENAFGGVVKTITTANLRDGSAEMPYLLIDYATANTLQPTVTGIDTFVLSYLQTGGLAKDYELYEDITLIGTNNWTSVGDATNMFLGYFEGNGKTINNLNIENSTAANTGLFGVIGFTVDAGGGTPVVDQIGTIRNFTINGINISSVAGATSTAVVAGINYGHIYDVTVIGTAGNGVRAVSGHAAGFVGRNHGTIGGTCSVSNLDEILGVAQSAGFVGLNNTTSLNGLSSTGYIIGSHSVNNIALIKNTGNAAGGFVGVNDAIIGNPDGSDVITVNVGIVQGVTNIGGFLANQNMNGEVYGTHSLIIDKVIGTGTTVGGFCGLFGGSWKGTFTLHSVDSVIGAGTTGGFAGSLSARYDKPEFTEENVEFIANNIGNVTATGNYVGGFAGTIHTSATSATTSLNIKFTNAASVTGVDYVGGFVGNITGANGFKVSEILMTGSVSGSKGVGGIVGSVNTAGVIISNSVNTSSVIGDSCVGGIVGITGNHGMNSASISDCYNTGDISLRAAIGAEIGGIFGRCGGTTTVARAYNTGTVGTDAIGDGVGGIAGRVDTYTTITQSISMGDIWGATNVNRIYGSGTANVATNNNFAYESLSANGTTGITGTLNDRNGLNLTFGQLTDPAAAVYQAAPLLYDFTDVWTRVTPDYTADDGTVVNLPVLQLLLPKN
jgi:uncharacterized protein (TIGR02145 family)